VTLFLPKYFKKSGAFLVFIFIDPEVALSLVSCRNWSSFWGCSDIQGDSYLTMGYY
jgi:hypothetical protein